MKLILAEKPSVAKNIAEALHIKNKNDGYYEGNGYLITWAFGHLLQLYDAKDYDSNMARWKLDNFPFIPSTFKYKVKQDPRNNNRTDFRASKQLKIITSLIRRSDVEAIISACDYDREGQLIGDSIIEKCRTTKTVYRLLLNEWTPDEVIKGLKELQTNQEMKPLRDAGVSRQWADWVIGINLTSVATLKYQEGKGKALNIGRVLLPTLKIIYDRDKEIETFKPENYYKLIGTFQTENNETFQGTYVEDKRDKFPTQDELMEIKNRLEVGKEATVINKRVQRKKEFPPYLFNLSNLQGYMTNKYKGWTSDKVLKVAQSLYEKKFITYPRTSSVALDESLVAKTAKVLQVVSEDLPFKKEITFVKSKRVFNNKKVESHSAIIPTYLKPNRLTADQELVYTAIRDRFVMQFMPLAEYEETKLTMKCNDDTIPSLFYSKGKVQLVEGWKKVEKLPSRDIFLPKVQNGEVVPIVATEIITQVTKPPHSHTEKTLLRVMETCGKNMKENNEEEVGSILKGFSIGTPATRAETIKKLKLVGYIAQKGKDLYCTDVGKKLVETFPVKQLFDLEFTGRLEKALADIERSNRSKEEFLQFIFKFTSSSVEKVKNEETVIVNKRNTSRKTKETLGNCPQCSHNVVEGTKGFGCSNWKSGCKFVIWKNDKFLATMKKRVTKTMVKALLKNNIAYVKGLTSKKGNKFNAYLRYTIKENGYFGWEMEFSKGTKQNKSKIDG